MSGLVDCDPGDPRFAAALADAGLPASAPAARCFALSDGTGFGVIEGNGADRLLRSVVVLPKLRGTGVGAALVASLIEQARSSGAERLWLLTTDAGDFFARHGWTVMHRAVAPAAIRVSDQFTTLCPASATLMVRAVAR